MNWATFVAAYFLGFWLFVLSPEPIDGVVFASCIGLVVASILIPLHNGEGWTGNAAALYLRLFVAQGVLLGISVFLAISSSTLHVSVEKYAGATLVIFPTLFFATAPALRLARLGEYLRRNGLDGIARRSSFGTRDDHFFLDYSIGRWFQHPSFALGYLGLVAVYFLGWFLVGVFSFLFSVPLLAIVVLISKRLARSLLSPYEPKDVASRIELIYPPKSLRNIPANPPLVLITFSYLVLIGYLAPNLFLFFLLTIPYAILLLYLRVIRRRFRMSDRH